ncbi:MAG: hypothetical protein CSA62_05585 [Planctomycetota bacterium]|nr:MAG: hypothetical protein CSA62_05585 [Planctomycetota bacterium]
MKLIELATLFLAILPVPILAQAELSAELFPALEEPDLDECRELAMRTLSAWPDSPAAALRAWALQGEGFRRQQAVLRVLGERQELLPEELRAGLGSAQWALRFEAARAAGNCLALPGLEPLLWKLLDDPFPAVRKQALASLERRVALDRRQLRGLLQRPGLARAAAKIWLAVPERFGPELLRDLLRDKAAAELILQRGLGCLRADCFPVLAAFAAEEDADIALRAQALLHLPLGSWPQRPEQLALRAARAGETGLMHRLAALLPAAAKVRLLEGLFAAPEDEFWDRMVLAFPLPAAALSDLAQRHAECPAESFPVFLTFLRRCAPKLLLRIAAKDFGRVADEARRAVWIAELAPLLKEHQALQAVFRAALKMEESVATPAFRACVGAQVLHDELLAWVAADSQRLQRHGWLLLLLDEPPPAEFYLALMAEESPRLRTLAAKGLRKHLGSEQVQAAVRRGFAQERSEAVRSAWLYALFAFAEEEEIARVVAELVAKKDPLLRFAVRKWFESSDRPFVMRMLRERAIPGWEREALLLRATRSDAAAGRKLWSMLHELDEAELLRARKGVTRALLPGDRELFEARLLGEGEARALPHVRDELITILRLRRDLPWGAMLRHALEIEQDASVREQLAAALAERKDFAALESQVQAWIENEGYDEAGLLCEVMGALSGEPSAEELRFLVRVLLAPIARDPLAGVRKEWERLRSRKRVEAQYPLLRPAARGLSRARPTAIAKALRAELTRPDRRLVWIQASKGYLLLALVECRAAGLALPALAPLVAWAQGLGPRPHWSDPELLLFSAELCRQEGDFAAAAERWQAGMRGLIRLDVRERELERICRGVVPGDAEHGLATLHAHGAWLAAIAAFKAGERQRALKILESGLIAARGDPALDKRLRATLAQME